ncbi:protein RER1B-like [Senna tora]|uniref:Protein RER1 n=1 Tax=Senna tora TaxID=362788 RepID=A0A834STY7_9FABA|nr:protein RER1B-like [Senna tora]
MEETGAGDIAEMAIANWVNDVSTMCQYYLDRWTPHTAQRWIGTLAIAIIYTFRIYYVDGFYLITYALGIYILNLLIGFLSPKVDPQTRPQDPSILPTKDSDDFKPFIRRLPEFKFWYSVTKAFVIAFVLTFFPVLDIPVFVPILICYWILLFILTMRRQIVHMIKYKYVPFDIGKKVCSFNLWCFFM